MYLSEALPLVRGQGEDACDVVVFRRLLLFGEVADDVEASVVPLAPDITFEIGIISLLC